MRNKLSQLKEAVDRAVAERGPDAEWYVSCYETLELGTESVDPNEQPPAPVVTYRCPRCQRVAVSRRGPVSCNCPGQPMMREAI